MLDTKLPKVKLNYTKKKDPGYPDQQLVVLRSIEIDGKRARRMSDYETGSRRIIVLPKLGLIIKADECYHSKLIKQTQTYREIKVHRKIKKKDQRFFPKMIHADKKNLYVVQEFIEMRVPKTPIEYAKAYRIVELMRVRYGIGDLGNYNKVPHNWAIRVDTGDPVIFDLGQLPPYPIHPLIKKAVEQQAIKNPV